MCDIAYYLVETNTAIYMQHRDKGVLIVLISLKNLHFFFLKTD